MGSQTGKRKVSVTALIGTALIAVPLVWFFMHPDLYHNVVAAADGSTQTKVAAVKIGIMILLGALGAAALWVPCFLTQKQRKAAGILGFFLTSVVCIFALEYANIRKSRMPLALIGAIGKKKLLLTWVVVFLIALWFAVLFNQWQTASILTAVTVCVFGVVCYFVYALRGEAFLASDLTVLGTAANVAAGYDYRINSSGLKILIDFVPNHVSRDYGKVGLSHVPQEGVLGASDDPSFHWRAENDFYYYPGQSLHLPCGGRYYENPAKASGNCFSPAPGINDWYETIRLNYCDFHTPTWDRMLEIVLYWCSKGVDGFRCDMVEMVPWQFMKWLIEKVKASYPGVIFIAEVYQKDLYRRYVEEVGFDLLYDKSGLYDTLRSVVQGDGTARAITWNWQSLGDLQPRMLNFLENHDEQRFASNFFAKDASKAAAPLCVSLLLNDSAFMIYNGQEAGERGMESEGFSGLDGRTTIFDWWSVPSLRRLYGHIHSGSGLKDEEKAVLDLYKGILDIARNTSGRTYDLCYLNEGSSGFDPDRHFAFLRGGEGRATLFVCDFSGKDSIVDVAITPEAFAYMGINKKETLVKSVSLRGYGYSALPV